MARNTTYGIETIVSQLKSWLMDLNLLIKFRLSALVVFSSALAYLIVAKEALIINWTAVLLLAIGGFCVTGASNILNQIIEVDYDKLMKRTANRPLAAGRRSISEALLLAGLMSVGGLIVLSTFNILTAFLGALALISYAFVYTPLKRYTPIAISVGAISGALPMLIGCTAFQAEITWFGLALFAIQFIWQFPHFWAIGVLAFDDYQKAGFKLIPTYDGKPLPLIGKQSFYYSLLLIPAGFVMYSLGWTNIAGAVGMTLPALYMFYKSYEFKKAMNETTAKALLFSSLYYLPMLLFSLYLFG